MKLIDTIYNEDGTKDAIAEDNDGLKYRLNDVFMGENHIESNELSPEEIKDGFASFTMITDVIYKSKELLDE